MYLYTVHSQVRMEASLIFNLLATILDYDYAILVIWIPTYSMVPI